METLLSPFTRRRPNAKDPVPLAVGTMNFGKRMSEKDSIRLVHHAIDRGATLFDTANAYVDGESERILGKALKDRRDRAVVATKVGFGRVISKPEGLSRARIKAALDESLQRLGMDQVDVYYLHVPDHATPIEETLDGLEEALAAGKTRHWAVSNFASWQVLEMLHIADKRGMPRPIMSQLLYNLLIRQLDIEWFRFAKTYEMHTTLYNPLAGGLLSGKHTAVAEPPKGSRFEKNALYQRRYWTNRFFELVSTYKTLAESLGMSLVEFSYAFMASTPGVDSILLGPGSREHLDAGIDACEKRLSDEVMKQIDQIHKEFLGTDASYAR